MADKKSTVELGIQFDQASEANINTAIGKIESRFTDLEKSAQNVGKAGQDAARTMSNALASVKDSADDDVKALDNLRASLSGAADDAKRLQQSGGGGSGFGVEGLRRTGGALSQLGLGAVGDPLRQIGDIGQVSKELGQVGDALEKMGGTAGSVGPVIAGLGTAVAAIAPAALVFIGGLELIRKAYENSDKAVKAAIASQETYYQTIAEGDSKSIRERIKKLQEEKDATDKLAGDITGAQSNAFAAAQKQYGDLGARILTALGSTGLYGDTLKDTTAKQDELTKKSGELQGQIDGLTKALDSSSVAANDAAKAQEKLTDALLQDAADKGRLFKQQAADADLTADQAKKRVQSLKDEQEALLAEYITLQQSGDTSDKVKERLAALQKQMDETSKEIDNLTDNIIPAKTALDDMAAAAERGKKQTQEEQKAIDDRNKALAGAVEKYDNDVAAIQKQGVEERLAIERKYQDTLVSIAQKAAEQAQDNLRKLQQEQEKLTIDFSRGEADAQRKAQYDQMTEQIKAQEDEAKSLVEHQRKLEDIRKQARQREFEFILDRNFLGLFQSQQQTRNDMENENTQFGRGQQDRSVARQQQSQDAARQREFEHQQRLVAYQQANEDAKRNYLIQTQNDAIARQRSIAQARQAEQVALADEARKITTELALKRQGIIAELNLIRQGEDAKLSLQKKYLAEANALLSGRSGGTLAPIPASRGPVSVNITSHVSTPNADPHQVAAISTNTTIEVLRKILGTGR